MKVSIIFTIILFFFFSSLVSTQTTQGDWELSLSGYMGSIKNSIKVTTPYN